MFAAGFAPSAVTVMAPSACPVMQAMAERYAALCAAVAVFDGRIAQSSAANKPRYRYGLCVRCLCNLPRLTPAKLLVLAIVPPHTARVRRPLAKRVAVGQEATGFDYFGYWNSIPTHPRDRRSSRRSPPPTPGTCSHNIFGDVKG